MAMEIIKEDGFRKLLKGGLSGGYLFFGEEDYLKAYAILRVRVSCPLEVLLQREIERGNRCRGSAEASFQYLYPQEGYDLTVDTHAMTSKDCAKKIAEYV